jgi:hypothetical protein
LPNHKLNQWLITIKPGLSGSRPLQLSNHEHDAEKNIFR